MFGFAKSPDGSEYFAGSGLSQDGIFRSTDRGEHFERVANHGVLCLHSGPGAKLWVCENPYTLGAPGIGLSADRGKTVNAIANFGDVLGAVTCDAGADAGGSLCADAWPDMRAGPSARRRRRCWRERRRGDPRRGHRRYRRRSGSAFRASVQVRLSRRRRPRKQPGSRLAHRGAAAPRRVGAGPRSPWIAPCPEWSMTTHVTPHLRILTAEISALSP